MSEKQPFFLGYMNEVFRKTPPWTVSSDGFINNRQYFGFTLQCNGFTYKGDKPIFEDGAWMRDPDSDSVAQFMTFNMARDFDLMRLMPYMVKDGCTWERLVRERRVQAQAYMDEYAKGNTPTPISIVRHPRNSIRYFVLDMEETEGLAKVLAAHMAGKRLSCWVLYQDPNTDELELATREVWVRWALRHGHRVPGAVLKDYVDKPWFDEAMEARRSFGNGASH